MGKYRTYIFILLILSLFLFASCGTTHVFSEAKGMDKTQMQTKFGPPTMVQPRPDGGETWIYKEQMITGDQQTIYYVVDSNGTVVDKRIVYEK